MHLTREQVESLSEQTLLDFLERKIPEGHSIDYKSDFSGSSEEKQTVEFLKDVTAFANASGGHVLIGVKEPSVHLDATSQVIGVSGGDAMARRCEHIASDNIDPRIPGILVRPIALVSGRHVIIVHIPPSLSRPHMVKRGKNRIFYVRHWEKSDPMTSHEIRESVIASMTAEAKAQQYLNERRKDCFVHGIAAQEPCLLVQAIPLIPLETEWDVLGEAMKKIVREGGNFAGKPYLMSRTTPTPTIYGIMGRNSNEKPKWITHVHRNGYLAAELLLMSLDNEADLSAQRCITGAYCNYFAAFGDLCERALGTTGTDRPYLLECSGLHFGGIILRHSEDEWSNPWPVGHLVLPYIIKPVGEAFSSVTDLLCDRLWNAFGFERK
jgi:hypothetical protein